MFMQTRLVRIRNLTGFAVLAAAAGIFPWPAGLAQAGADAPAAGFQPQPVVFVGTNATASHAAAATAQPRPLVWDALEKEAWPDTDEESAEFKFTATNVSDA